MAKLIHIDGRTEEVFPVRRTFSLQELYQYVCPGDSDPIVEAVRIANGIIWCHERGKILELPVNDIATAIYGHYIPGDVFVGPVLVTRLSEVD